MVSEVERRGTGNVESVDLALFAGEQSTAALSGCSAAAGLSVYVSHLGQGGCRCTDGAAVRRWETHAAWELLIDLPGAGRSVPGRQRNLRWRFGRRSTPASSPWGFADMFSALHVCFPFTRQSHGHHPPETVQAYSSSLLQHRRCP